MQVGRKFGTFHDHIHSPMGDDLDWTYENLRAEVNEVKTRATRYQDPSLFTIDTLDFNQTDYRPVYGGGTVLPIKGAVAIGIFLEIESTSTSRTMEWCILYPMENRCERTGRTILQTPTSSNDFRHFLHSDKKIYYFFGAEKKLYRFDLDGSNLEYLIDIKTPNNINSGIYTIGRSFSPNFNKYYYFSNQSSTTFYWSCIDLDSLISAQGTSSAPSLNYIVSGKFTPNGKLVLMNINGSIKVCNVNYETNTFSSVSSNSTGSYAANGFSVQSIGCFDENCVFINFGNHESYAVKYNYETNTFTNSNFKPSVASNYQNTATNGTCYLPTGEHFCNLQAYYDHFGNCIIIYDDTQDSWSYVTQNDGSSTSINCQGCLLPNGKIFLANASSASGQCPEAQPRYRLIDIGLNTSFSYSVLTNPWFGTNQYLN